MGQAVQRGTCQAFATEDFGPAFEGQVGRDNHAGSFVRGTDHIEQEFRAQLARRDEPQLVSAPVR